ncbi:hypothetical protein QUF54_02560 [Candidatus Marithioploca araucensis]|uniref:Uncharacterized protein n=1 Tax=Candidatus Marithioploca araucensis TaxID=70273 RepID=A0ABT7VRE4_9GAMM|nr:hypothetical protein [Candidatus Marithioploca araucensis]
MKRPTDKSNNNRGHTTIYLAADAKSRAAEEECYPDETLHLLSPSRYGRVTLRTTKRSSGQFTFMLNAAQLEN